MRSLVSVALGWPERLAARSPATAGRATPRSRLTSKPAQAGVEPRQSLPSEDRPMDTFGEDRT
jgi:hypothetical protein